MRLGTKTLLAVICAVAVASVYSAQPILAEMGAGLGVPTDALGWIVAVGQLGYLVGLVFLVPLGDLLNRRHLIALHLLVLALGAIVIAVAQTAWVALGGIALTGLLAVVVQTTVAYAAAASAPEERGRTLGFVTSGVVIGILGSRVLSGALTDLWGWRAVYLTLAVLAMVLGVAALLLLPRDVRSPSGRYLDLLQGVGSLLADRVFLSRGLIAFFRFASFGALWSGMALPLTASPWHLTETQIGLFGLAGLAGALGAGRAGRWADAGHADKVTGMALVLLLASWVLIDQLAWTLALLAIGVVVLDFAVQAVHVSNQHMLTSRRPGRVSTTVGAYMLFYSLGSAAGAAATTAIYSVAGWTGCAVLGAAFAAAGLLTWALAAPAVHAARTPQPAGAIDA